MITTKAYITQVPSEGSNMFKVDIPLMQDNVSEEAIFDALLCSTSGNYNDYKVGDCVFVDFEDDKYNTAIIMGKLYTEVPEENEAYGLFNELKVTGSAILPENTKLGQYTAQDIFNLYQGVQSSLDAQGDWVSNIMLQEYLKEYVSKEAFNTFYGDKFFDVDTYPYKIRITFNNEIETGTTDANKIWNNNYNPDYKTLKNDWQTFIQTRMNKFLGLASTGTAKPSIAKLLSEINNTMFTGIVNYDLENVDKSDYSTKTKNTSNANYFPDYSNLVNHWKKFIQDTWEQFVKIDLPTAFIKIKNWVKDWTNSNFVRFKKDDEDDPNPVAKIIRVVSGETYDDPSFSKDQDTMYFLTSVPPSEKQGDN